MLLASWVGIIIANDKGLRFILSFWLVFLSFMLTLTLIADPQNESGYEKGQIDAMNGIIKYKQVIEVTPAKTDTLWVEIETNK